MRRRIVIIGGGTAGISVAARLRRAGQADITLVEPSKVHYYQPLWTLVGGGRAPVSRSVRDEAGVIPKGVNWIQDFAEEIDPDGQVIATRAGVRIGYDFLVVCPGIQLDWGRIPGLSETLGRGGVSSNYRVDLAPKTWDSLKDLRGGVALFTHPSGPIKCAGAPQKIAYLAADWWQKQGVLKDIQIVLALATPAIFGVPEFARVLERVVDRYGIDLRLQHELTEVDPDRREALLVDRQADKKFKLSYDFLHAVPPQSAPDWIKVGPLADPKDPNGYVEVDKNTHQHARYPNVFALGDAGSTPNSKTGAAIRKQAPVVVENLLAVMAGREPPARYDGYASCPLTTARKRMLLAEFDYTMRPHPTIPGINTQRERYDMWLLKRYGLPFMYWNLMLRGRA